MSNLLPRCWRTALAVALAWGAVTRPPVAGAAADPATSGLLERFDRLDKNGDKKVTAAELGMPALFQRMDANKDGFVTKPEAEGFLGEARARLQQRLQGGLGAPGDDAINPTAPADDSPRQGPKRLKPVDHGVGALVPDVEFTDLAGKKRRLSELQGHRAVVVAVTSTTCPVSKRYAPTLARLEQAYGDRDVAFVFLNPVSSDTRAQMRAAVRQHRFKGPYVPDPSGEFARALGALSTGDAFVLDAARTLVYRGAVDDQYGLAYALDAPRQEYLAGALEALYSGNPPAIAATTAPGCALEWPAQASAPAGGAGQVTYHNRISRLMQSHCVECHRAGGVAPFSLETREDVSGHAGMIRKQVERGLMPPWFAAPPAAGEHSPWANDRSLSARDKADLLAWLGAGRPAGNPADAPLPRLFPETWSIGKPDLVVQIPEPIAVKAQGTMPYQNVTAETLLTEDKWVRALEVLPTAREVVHHVLVFVRLPADKAGGKRRRDGDEERGGFFAAFVPGNNAVTYPDGFAKLLPAGSALKFQIHYTPNGTVTRDQVRIGLRFADKPPRHIVHVIGLVNPLLSIPPGADNHEEQAGIPILKTATVLSFMPHMHVRGKAFRYEATWPDGVTRTLLDVPRYDFNWQLAYRYAEPLTLPFGARLRARGWFDNSAGNPANPDPARTVRWGPQTTDEMMLGYVEYYFPDEKPPTIPSPTPPAPSARDGERPSPRATPARLSQSPR